MPALTRKRQVDIDILRCVGICLVVLGHSFPSEVPWLISLFRSFTMPLFMVISGYLYIYSDGIKKGYVRFVLGKVKLLLVPYVLLSCIAFIPKSLLAQYAQRPIELNWQYWGHSLLYPTENVVIYFWFMPTLFLITLMGPVFSWALKHKLAALSLTIGLTALHLIDPLREVLLLNLAGVSHYVLFFWLGSLLANGKEQTEHMMEGPVLLPLLMSALFLLYLASSKFHLLLDLPLALIGTAMAFAFGKWYVRKQLTWFQWLQGYTYTIYLLSWFPQVLVMVVLFKVLHLPYSLTVALMFISGLVVPVVTAKMISRYFPILNMMIGLKPTRVAYSKAGESGLASGPRPPYGAIPTVADPE